MMLQFNAKGKCDWLFRFVLTGTVGPPVACNFVKLVDVPEYDYYTANNQGEVRNI